MNLTHNKKQLDKALLAELSQALASSDDPELIRNFLYSILTAHEVRDVSLHWTLVRMIDIGMSQRVISRELGLSLCKITRGSKELKKPNSAFVRMIRILQKK